MTQIAVAAFDVTGWDQTPYDDGFSGPSLSKARVRKHFTGDLDGESVAELLMCQADPSGLDAGAGYVASERFSGSVQGFQGSFIFQHWGLTGGDAPPQTGGHIVTGTGTEELTGIAGDITISVTPEGAHSIELRYTI